MAVPGMQMLKVILSKISLILFLHGCFHPGSWEADQEKGSCQGRARVLLLRRVSKMQLGFKVAMRIQLCPRLYLV